MRQVSKAALGLPRFERQTTQLEEAMDRLADEVSRAVAEADDDPRAARRELTDLARRVSRIASTAQEIAAEVASARDTLVGLDTVGVEDAADDADKLDALAERLEAVERQAADAADTVAVTLDELEEAGIRSANRVEPNMTTAYLERAGDVERLQSRFCEVKLADSSAKTGTFSGYGAFFGNEDGYGDVIAHGAFAATLREWKARGKLPPMLLQHGGGPFGGNAGDMLPIGQWLSMEENSEGLKVEGRLFAMQTDRGQYIWEGLKAGVLDGLSIGYLTREARMGTKPHEPSRILTDIELLEVSVVLNPANTMARVTAVKALTVEQLRDWKAAFREEGLSRADAERAIWAVRKMRRREAGDPGDALRKAAAPEQTAEHEALAAVNALMANLVAGSLKL